MDGAAVGGLTSVEGGVAPGIGAGAGAADGVIPPPCDGGVVDGAPAVTSLFAVPVGAGASGLAELVAEALAPVAADA
jgi:hypothetical protein